MTDEAGALPRSRRLLLRAVKGVAVAADGVRRPGPGVVVLAYHRVGGAGGGEIDLPVGLFEEQMAALAATGQVLRLGDALAQITAGGLGAAGPADGRTVAVTFDDGTADLVEHALPILVRHRIPATCYVATDHLERQRPFPGGAAPLSWQALADAVSTGLVDVGSHTHTHALLDRAEAVTHELDRSIELIEDRLGLTPRDFAYPKAVPGPPHVEREVRTRFRSAALAGNRPNQAGRTDPHRLARTPIQRSDGMRYFRHKVAGGMWLEGELRRLASRVRYHNATR